MKNNNASSHMPRWLWIIAVIEFVTGHILATRGYAADVALVYAATGGGIVGFAIRDWRAKVDAS